MQLNPQAHGAVPFWFWNGDQCENEITRQLELAAAGGLRGLAIHARTGNRTEYMSERWLALIRHACEEARRLGLEIWIYDEEGFPSGTVGHRLQKDEPFYQQKRLCYAYQRGADLVDSPEVVAVYDARSLERLDVNGVARDLNVLVFRMVCLPRYVDALKRETADRFIEMTHDVYLRELAEYFGDPITHVYTDDLNSYLDRGASLPWTERLSELFQERLGYDLLDHLPALIEAVPGREKVRLDFRGLVLDLFLCEFVEPMHRWCDEHGVRFTGHLSGDEGDITKSVQRFGSAMAFYEHEHIPGIDDFLCSVSSGCYLDELRNGQGHCPVILFKQASSVANQLKNGTCSCEVLTFLGWGASMWGQSAFLNYELALGVNLMVHHAFSYATGGVAKRDCPPSYFFQQPYWPQYKRFHDAIARSTQLLTRGTFDADTLVIHPMSSCWIAMDGRRCSIGQPFETRTEETRADPLALEESLAAVSHELLMLQVGFEYGDEWLLARHGAVRDGGLQVGAMRYSTVVLPEVSNLLESTVVLLEAFQRAGGRLIAVNPAQDCLVDGVVPDGAVFGSAGTRDSSRPCSPLLPGARLSPECIEEPVALRACALKPTIELEIAEAGAPVICHTRVVDGGREHFVCNMSDRSQRVGWGGEWRVYDPVEDIGIIRSTGASPAVAGAHACETSPAVAGAHACETSPAVAGATPVGDGFWLPPFHAVHLLKDLPAGVAVRRIEETVFGGEPTSGSRGLHVTHACRARVCLASDWTITPEQPNLMLIDWFDGADDEARRLVVNVEIPDPSRVSGVMGETVTLATMRVNGSPLPEATEQHPSSQDMLIADAAGLLRGGENRFTIARQHGDVPFEPFYLVGDFGVELVETGAGMRPRLSKWQCRFGDLAESGLPFYWGTVKYETELAATGGEAWLDCGDADGVVAVSVNGRELGCRYRPPYRFYVADHLVSGANRITLTLFNTAQNLYGPHRRDFGVALHPCERRGNGNGDYFLAAFGVRGPVSFV